MPHTEMDPRLSLVKEEILKTQLYFCDKTYLPSADSVGISQSRWRRAGWLGFDSRQCKIFLFSKASRPNLGPSQHPILWVQGANYPGVKLKGREADHSPPSDAEVKKVGAIPPLPHMSSWHCKVKMSLCVTN
jgi:hypothetical protein